jgi:hypothetical protein
MSDPQQLKTPRVWLLTHAERQQTAVVLDQLPHDQFTTYECRRHAKSQCSPSSREISSLEKVRPGMRPRFLSQKMAQKEPAGQGQGSQHGRRSGTAPAHHLCVPGVRHTSMPQVTGNQAPLQRPHLRRRCPPRQQRRSGAQQTAQSCRYRHVGGVVYEVQQTTRRVPLSCCCHCPCQPALQPEHLHRAVPACSSPLNPLECPLGLLGHAGHGVNGVEQLVLLNWVLRRAKGIAESKTRLTLVCTVGHIHG